MKKTIFLLALICLASVLTSCDKENDMLPLNTSWSGEYNNQEYKLVFDKLTDSITYYRPDTILRYRACIASDAMFFCPAKQCQDSIFATIKADNHILLRDYKKDILINLYKKEAGK